jgi:hypothetical protein
MSILPNLSQQAFLASIIFRSSDEQGNVNSGFPITKYKAMNSYHQIFIHKGLMMWVNDMDPGFIT